MAARIPTKTKAPARLALFGGTFDPVHWGHLIGAQDVLEQLALDRVLFIPAAQSPHKRDRASTPAAHRLGMLRAAVAKWPRFGISRAELDRPAPSYAIETVTEIAAANPGAKLFWIIGADQLPKLRTWERFEELRARVTFTVLVRQGEGARLGRLPHGILRLPHARQIDISATEIRARVARRLPIEHLVPPGVARYIARTGLYKA